MREEPTEVERLDDAEALRFTRYRNIVILTGAGVSVASGIKPFRGPGGLWNDPQVEQFAHREALHDDPEGAWRFFAFLRLASSVWATSPPSSPCAWPSGDINTTSLLFD